MTRNSFVFTLILCIYSVFPAQSIFFPIMDMAADLKLGVPVVSASQCGPTDDRESSDDPRIGRLLPGTLWSGRGTACIVMNGALVTAGHIFPDLNGMVEFNVPDSTLCGQINPSDPADRYTANYDPGSVVSGGGSDGSVSDWAVFVCDPNTQTGLLPHEAQRAFYRVWDDVPQTAQVRVTGYGTDFVPPYLDASCPLDPSPGQRNKPYNSDNCTLQTHSAPLEIIEPEDGGEIIEYGVDTEGGTSGAPVSISATTAVGIHIFADCTNNYYHGYNWGTSFNNDALKAAINSFTPTGTVYVDKGHPYSGVDKDGTLFKPFHTVSSAAIAVPSGGTIGIVAGAYKDTLTIKKAVTLVAPFGTVSIGGSL